MFNFKTGTVILLERPNGLKGCTEIEILQNWRNLLRINVRNTSGTRASDVWSEPETYTVSEKTLKEDLMEEIYAPYGDEITFLR